MTIRYEYDIYGKQLFIPIFKREIIMEHLMTILEFYPNRDMAIVADRVTECILAKQRIFRTEIYKVH